MRIPGVMELVREGGVIPLCPEQLGGMTTPREPSEARAGRVVSKSGLDVTAQFEKGAAVVLDAVLSFGCREAILKSRSPSCGSGMIYDGSFGGRLVEGDGVTAPYASSPRRNSPGNRRVGGVGYREASRVAYE